MVVTEADLYHHRDDHHRDDAAAQSSVEASSEEDEGVPSKVPRLLAKYNRHRNKSGGCQQEDSTRRQLARYLDEAEQCKSPNALQFWQDNSKKLPALYKLANKVLAIPASSAPVERVFSRGGVIMRPHRARLSAEMLSILMFLKCNEGVV